MNYISTKEAAAKWGVSLREVQRLLAENRMPGAKRYGNYWMVPADAAKPIDPRKARKLPRNESASHIFLTSADLPKGDPDAALHGLEGALRPLAAADAAFRRGDSEPAKAVWRETPHDAATKLSAASLATAAAISSGDYALYDEVQRFLHAEIQRTQSQRDKALLSLPGTLAAVSMAVPAMAPDWLTSCDFSLFPCELRPFLLYLYVLHLRNTGSYAEMLGVAKATLTLLEKPVTFTWLDVYLYILCAVAAGALGNAEQAMHYLDSALELGLPCGFIAPFADNLGSFGGMLEVAIERQAPQYVKPIYGLWESSFKNWMRFHNAFAKDNITTLLTVQEYQTARLLAGGATYAEASKRMSLSVGRIKNIASGVYAKLYIKKREELSSLIL